MNQRAPSSVVVRMLGLVVMIATGSVTALAHDMWIEPTSYLAALDRTIGLKLRVGQDFMGDPLPRDPALIDQFIVVDGDGEKPVVGRDGADPAGLIRPSKPGLLVIGYHSKPSAVVLTAEKFNTYLSEEGLDTIAALRAKRGETNAGSQEAFARCAKTLVLVGPSDASQRDRVLGFPLELIADGNPYRLAPGQSVRVRLLFRGQPLAGTLVTAINQREPAAKVAARSDRAGHVQLRLAQAGPWLIKAVHMIEAPVGSGNQWASFWASLTFEVAGTPGRADSSSRR